MGYKYEVVYFNTGDTYTNHKIFKYYIFALPYYWYCNFAYDFAAIGRRTLKWPTKKLFILN